MQTDYDYFRCVCIYNLCDVLLGCLCILMIERYTSDWLALASATLTGVREIGKGGDRDVWRVGLKPHLWAWEELWRDSTP